MGLFNNLKNKYLSQQTETAAKTTSVPSVPSILPVTAVSCIQNGILPQIKTNSVFLSAGEQVHYIERAVIITEKNLITGYSGGSSGWSFQVIRGVSYRTGKRQGVPIREDVQEYTKGTLYITSKRILFVAKKNGFDKPIKTLSALMPYANGMGMQFGRDTYNIVLPDGNILYSLLNMLRP